VSRTDVNIWAAQFQKVRGLLRDCSDACASDEGHRGPSGILDGPDTSGVASGCQCSDHRVRIDHRETGGAGFYQTALRVLNTLTPAVLIVDSQRNVVFANHKAKALLDDGSMISLDKRGHVYCADIIAQNYLLEHLMARHAGTEFLTGSVAGSFLVPKIDGWPMAALVGRDQLELFAFCDGNFDPETHITLMLRDENGYHPEKSDRLKLQLGLEPAGLPVDGKLIVRDSLDKSAQAQDADNRAVHTQLKSTTCDLEKGQGSDLVSFYMRYIS